MREFSDPFVSDSDDDLGVILSHLLLLACFLTLSNTKISQKEYGHRQRSLPNLISCDESHRRKSFGFVRMSDICHDTRYASAPKC